MGHERIEHDALPREIAGLGQPEACFGDEIDEAALLVVHAVKCAIGENAILHESDREGGATLLPFTGDR